VNKTIKEYDEMRKVCPHIFDLLNFLNEIHVALMLHFEKIQFSPMKVWAWPLVMLISWYFLYREAIGSSSSHYTFLDVLTIA
jgi:hypothetical protein